MRQLRAMEKRARIAATFMLGVESADVAARARAGEALLRRIQALDARALGIGGVTSDDGVLRRYTWDNRFLFADLDDLTAARDALRDRMMKANPLYVARRRAGRPTEAGGDGWTRSARSWTKPGRRPATRRRWSPPTAGCS